MYVPLNTKHTHEHCSEFAQAVAQVLEKHHPKRVTSTMAKSARPGQGLHRLEPEQPPQDDGGRVLAASAAASDGEHAGDVGRGRGRPPSGADLSFEAADVLARVEEHGDLFAETLEVKQKLPKPNR